MDVPPITILTDFLASLGFAAASTINPVAGIIEMIIKKDNNRAANLFDFLRIIIQSFLIVKFPLGYICFAYLIFSCLIPYRCAVWNFIRAIPPPLNSRHSPKFIIRLWIRQGSMLCIMCTLLHAIKKNNQFLHKVLYKFTSYQLKAPRQLLFFYFEKL